MADDYFKDTPSTGFLDTPDTGFIREGDTLYITCEAGSFAVTGFDIDFYLGYYLAGAGAYSVDGTDATLLHDHVLSAGAGSVAVTGTDADFSLAYVISHEAGSIVITGTDVDFTHIYTISAEAGAIEVTGFDVAFTYLGAQSEYSLLIETGSVVVTGTDASLLSSYLVDAGVGAYTITGVDAGLNIGKVLSVDAGSIAVTGADADLTRPYLIIAGKGTYIVTGKNVNFSPVLHPAHEEQIRVDHPDRWVRKNKGLGSWAFMEQQDKWGYLNNPRWSDHPKGAADPISATQFCEAKGLSLDTEIHKPCGHWHKKAYYIPQINIGTTYWYQQSIDVYDGNIGIVGMTYEGDGVNDGIVCVTYEVETETWACLGVVRNMHVHYAAPNTCRVSSNGYVAYYGSMSDYKNGGYWEDDDWIYSMRLYIFEPGKEPRYTDVWLCDWGTGTPYECWDYAIYDMMDCIENRIACLAMVEKVNGVDYDRWVVKTSEDAGLTFPTEFAFPSLSAWAYEGSYAHKLRMSQDGTIWVVHLVNASAPPYYVQLWKSTDGGENFTKVWERDFSLDNGSERTYGFGWDISDEDGKYQTISISKSYSTVNDRIFYVSDDYGSTFATKIFITTDCAVYNNLVANENYILAFARNYVPTYQYDFIRSIDAATSFSFVNLSDYVSGITISWLDVQKHINEVVTANCGSAYYTPPEYPESDDYIGVAYSNDGGITWIVIQSPLPNGDTETENYLPGTVQQTLQEPQVWPFEIQEDKFGYLNNPRWSDHPKGAADPISATQFCEAKGLSLDTEIHKPCGHWHKRKPVTIFIELPNLYGTGSNQYGQTGLEGDNAGGYAEPYNTMTDSTFTQVACGWYHSLALKSDGTLWSTGVNSNGQLGLGDKIHHYYWEQVGTDADWASIFCGDYNSFAIKTDGSLYACGWNGYYNLGLGDDIDKTSFTQVGVATNWVDVGAGYSNTIFINSLGEAWGVGENYEGELGLGHELEITTLTQIPGTSWVNVSCGQYHSMMIDSSGYLYGSGYNYYGHLGLGDEVDRNTFTQVGSDTWSNVECGNEHTIAIKSDGTLWSTGQGNLGQLGLGLPAGSYVTSFNQIGSASNWIFIAAGVEASGAINSSNELWVCGSNGNAKLGTGGYEFSVLSLEQVLGEWSFVDYGFYHMLALKFDGTLWVAGANYYGCLGTGVNFTDVLTLVNDEIWTAVDCWSNHTLAIKEDDQTVWGCGYCYYGQLGLAEGYERWQLVQLSVGSGWDQVATGGYHSIIFKDGQIWGAGYNTYGQLGLGYNATRVTEFIQLSGTDWAFIAAGANCTMAINSSGELFSTGLNSGGGYGMLGLGDTTDRNVLTQCIGTGWKQVSIGGCHAAAVRDDGTLWTTGKNTQGQLGLGDNAQRIIWTQVAGTNWDYVECGYNFTLAVDTSGDLYGTGDNSCGQLGLNDLVNRNSFTFISSGWLHDSYNGLAQFSGGCIHSLAIYGSDISYATGDNYYGQLGLDCSGFEAVQNGGLPADEDRKEFEETSESIPIDGEQDYWDFVVCGEYHTMALKIVGEIEITDEFEEPQVWSLPTKGPSL